MPYLKDQAVNVAKKAMVDRKVYLLCPGDSFPAGGQEYVLSLATPDGLYDVVGSSRFPGALVVVVVVAAATILLPFSDAVAVAVRCFVPPVPGPASSVCHHHLVLQLGRGVLCLRARIG